MTMPVKADEQSVGAVREQFAWLPVRCFANPDPFTAPIGWYWLSQTTQTRTGMEGWIAYDTDNRHNHRFTDTLITCLSIMATVATFCIIATTIHPIVRGVSQYLG